MGQLKCNFAWHSARHEMARARAFSALDGIIYVAILIMHDYVQGQAWVWSVSGAINSFQSGLSLNQEVKLNMKGDWFDFLFGSILHERNFSQEIPLSVDLSNTWMFSNVALHSESKNFKERVCIQKAEDISEGKISIFICAIWLLLLLLICVSTYA
jgi:hypothetical protein